MTSIKRSVLLSAFLLVACGPIALGPVKPNPFVRAVEGMKDKTLQIHLAPAVQDAFRMEPTDMRPIDVTQFRTSIRDGLAAAFSGSFQNVVFVDSEPASGIVLRIERCEPIGLKAGNVSMGKGIVAYDLRFDVRYIASLLEEGNVVRTIQNEVTGKDTSWKADDQPKLMSNSLEIMITDLRERVFAQR